MASSSSDSSIFSTESEASWEMTSEFDPKATYEACAPLHWDEEEWDFWAWLEDDKSLTDGSDSGSDDDDGDVSAVPPIKCRKF
jgi:hypothetical protein